MLTMSSLGRQYTDELLCSLEPICPLSGVVKAKRCVTSLFFRKTRYAIPAKYAAIPAKPNIPRKPPPQPPSGCGKAT